jgi:hypothetical protein
MLEGANTRYFLLQSAKGIRNLANLIIGGVRLVLEYHDMPQRG